MPPAPNKVTGVVVTCQSENVVGACVEALCRQVGEVIVIDNASTDRTLDRAAALGATLIRNENNEGYGRANNRAILAAVSAEWCLITNPDVTVDPGCVDELLAATARHPSATIIVPRLIEPDGRVFFRSQSALSRAAPSGPKMENCPDAEQSISFASGACMLVHRQRFLNLGGFDDQIFLFYEDDDLCLRVRRAGQEVVFAHAALAHHHKGTSSTPARGAIYRRRFHLAWSRIYICRKHGLADDGLLVIARNAIKAIGALLTFNQNRCERYAGSVAGAWAAMRGRAAFKALGETQIPTPPPERRTISPAR
jgi:N-acetylglucosaminyl-diphospho-decaprenol L-rhamnosyltransferase